MRTSRLMRLVSRGAILAAMGAASVAAAASPAAAAELTADQAVVSPLSIEWTSYPSHEGRVQPADDDDRAPRTGLEEKSIEWT